MNKKTTLIFAIIVLIFAAAVLIFVQVLFPKPDNKTLVQSSSSQVSLTSSTQRYSLDHMIEMCDTVISGSVIKADVDGDGVLYTFEVTKVYKGRNYTSMGYAYLYGKQTLKIGGSYLFLGVTGTEKYHYYEPFANAPWVFEISEDNALRHCSNGDTSLVSGIENIKLEQFEQIKQ